MPMDRLIDMVLLFIELGEKLNVAMLYYQYM